MDFQAGMIVLIVFVSLFAIWLVFYFIPVGLWFSALVSGVRVSLLQLILMRWRKVPPSTIVSSMIESTKAGLDLNPNELEAHYLAGGNVTNVVHALVSAQKANIMLDFKMATAIDLAGRDVFEAVQMSVNPKVINTPPVAAVAKDGIQLIAKARVTVRANIKQLVGGAGEETVLARVGEGIVSSIGSAASHKIVLENPDSISCVVLEKGLDAGTAFEILSIDIADIDVGKNIGAQLQMDQAQADKNIAQAKAEERRAMAVALEQGEYGEGAGRTCQSDPRRSGGAAGDGRGVPQRQSGDHGLLQDEEHHGRYVDARDDRQAGEEVEGTSGSAAPDAHKAASPTGRLPCLAYGASMLPVIPRRRVPVRAPRCVRLLLLRVRPAI